MERIDFVTFNCDYQIKSRKQKSIAKERSIFYWKCLLSLKNRTTYY